MEYVSDLKSPHVFKNILTWKIVKWSLDDWKEFFTSDNLSKKFSFRCGNQYCSEEPLWERNCNISEMSMLEFFEKYACNATGNSKDWLYFDYKHIAEWFSSEAEKMEVTWKEFGFPDKTAKDSTIWIGTKGAHTPCHMDTYGFNLIAQIWGQKRWFLFPPSETESLRPTRVPYEESSIYSSINFACGCADVSSIKNVKVVTLNPGDVLLVPFHWWHFVENLSTAISINIWLPTSKDDTIRLEESLVKYFICSVCRSIDSAEDILNPNEDDIPSIKEDFNIKELSWCLDKCKQSGLEPLKIQLPENKLDSNEVPNMTTKEFVGILKSKCSEPKKNSPEKDIRKHVINSFCHPDIIALVRAKLQESMSVNICPSTSSAP